MESPPPLHYISQSSKKRVFRGSSSSTCMEADVVEIPPPANWSSNLKSIKRKEVISLPESPEVIDVDLDEESADVIMVDTEVDKGKEIFGKNPLGSSIGTNQGLGNSLLHPSEKNIASGSHYLINGDDFGADLFYGENEYMDLFHDDNLYDDDYASVQAHLDSLGIPPGVEVSVPWFTGHQDNKMKSAVASTSTHSSSPIDLDALGFPPRSDSSSSTRPWEFEQLNDKSTPGGSSLGAKLKALSFPEKQETSSSWLLDDPARVRKRSTSAWSSINLPSKPPVDTSSFSLNMELHKSEYRSAEYWRSKTKRNPQSTPHVSTLTKPLDMSGFADPQFTVHSFPSAPYPSGFADPFGPLPFFPDDVAFVSSDMDPLKGQRSATAPENSYGSFSGKEKYGDPNEFLKNFDSFKRFDIVQDSKDHHYYGQGSSLKQPSKHWAKKIQEEWRILENDLPETIYVRAYESRMDLMRAAIIGAEGTPYHDGLFFFDVFFPDNYPNVPPLVYYHSGGLRINPNLYQSGKVCLSLLNTWNGTGNEKWIPGFSTILQVLVSIQGLILNAKPFFNEPGYANMSNTPSGEKSSLKYNENSFILSLKTMVYSIRRPPKYFEYLVAGHFFKRARDILVACNAYINGAQVGCLVKGGVQDVDEGDKSCSHHFKDTLAQYIKTLVDTFAEIGVKDCDEFLSLAQKTNSSIPTVPMRANYY